MEKCDLCPERWEEGRKPVCVDSCPARALDAGPLEDLIKKYRSSPNAEGFTYSNDLKPSIVFKSKKRESNEYKRNK
jgi:anaerobic dimethyl sulfoxide reductase subunit B (iron-sulfur subunit)